MADVSMAATQDAIADSLLGEPEETQQSVEQPETERQTETSTEQQTTEQATEQQTEETVDDWLPSDQDRTFSDDTLLRYAQRYGYEALPSDPRQRQLLVDKINTDIYLRQIREQEELDRELREQEQQRPEQQRQEPTQPQLTTEQYLAQLDRVIQERTDPEMAKQFHDGFLRAFGVPDAEIAKATPQQQMALTNHMSKFALNLFRTFAPDMFSSLLPEHIGQLYPEFGDMYERSAHALAWDRVRNAAPQYKSLPAYGTHEFSAALREAAGKVPEIADMIAEADGKPFDSRQVQRWYGILARIASGQSVDPALLQRAAAAGARNANRARVVRQAGQLGSGQTKSAAGQQQQASRFSTNSDLFDEETMGLYEQGRRL